MAVHVNRTCVALLRHMQSLFYVGQVLSHLSRETAEAGRAKRFTADCLGRGRPGTCDVLNLLARKRDLRVGCCEQEDRQGSGEEGKSPSSERPCGTSVGSMPSMGRQKEGFWELSEDV